MPRKTNATYRVGQVSVHKKGRIYHARYPTPIGRRERTLKTSNLKAALRRARELDERLDRDPYVTPDEERRRDQLTFSQYLEEFLKNYDGWSESTRKGNQYMIRFLDEEFGDLPLQAITPRLVETYLARRRDIDGITTGTRNRYLATLKAIFKVAVRWGYLSQSPVDQIKTSREQQKIPQALTEQQFELLLAELNEPARSIVLIAGETGMRRSEIRNMRWNDIDFADRSIRIPTRKNQEFLVLPMTERAYRLLLQRRERSRRATVTDIRVLPFVDIKKALSGAAKRAGIGHVTLHMLRHTFATRLRELGVPLDRIKELLGHRTMAMTLRYAKASPNQLREAITALDG